jgi:hypothetical protein
VRELGIELRVLTHRPGQSSTRVIEQMNETPVVEVERSGVEAGRES